MSTICICHLCHHFQFSNLTILIVTKIIFKLYFLDEKSKKKSILVREQSIFREAFEELIYIKEMYLNKVEINPSVCLHLGFEQAQSTIRIFYWRSQQPHEKQKINSQTIFYTGMLLVTNTGSVNTTFNLTALNPNFGSKGFLIYQFPKSLGSDFGRKEQSKSKFVSFDAFQIKALELFVFLLPSN